MKLHVNKYLQQNKYKIPVLHEDFLCKSESLTTLHYRNSINGIHYSFMIKHSKTNGV